MRRTRFSPPVCEFDELIFCFSLSITSRNIFTFLKLWEVVLHEQEQEDLSYMIWPCFQASVNMWKTHFTFSGCIDKCWSFFFVQDISYTNSFIIVTNLLLLVMLVVIMIIITTISHTYFPFPSVQNSSCTMNAVSNQHCSDFYKRSNMQLSSSGRKT